MSGHARAGIVTVEAAVEAFLQDLRARGYSPASLRTYEAGLRDLSAHLAGQAVTDLREIEPADLEVYRSVLVERGLAAQSSHLYLRAARLLFAFLEERQWIFESPARDFVLQAPVRHLAHVPSEADVARLLASPDVSTPQGLRERALLEVAYATGARLGELLALTLHDPDLVRQTLTLRGKGGHERVVPLGAQGTHWLREYIERARPKLVGPAAGEALWIGGKGMALSARVAERDLRKRCRVLGLHPSITPHALRRACATHMLARGAHPAEICELLGHASLRHLCQYLSVSLAEVRRMHARTKPGG